MEELEMRAFVYGQRQIDYGLCYAERKMMEIAVHPNGAVVVKAPLDADMELIELKLRKRARWVLRQLLYFDQFNPKTPPRSFVSGESHLYLGRQYRLRVLLGDANGVRLTGGYFCVSCTGEPSSARARVLMQRWYDEKAKAQFAESLARCWPRFEAMGFDIPRLSIRRMRTRWGSLSPRGTMTLNRGLIRAPKECLDYVVIHELCHLVFPTHCAGFYKLLDRMSPEWQRVKHKLELCMV